MSVVTSRRPSPLQKRILIVLAALDARRPGPVATRDIERLLARAGDAPVYGPNLRASCRRLEAAGWLRTLRAPNLQLAVELTETGSELAMPLLKEEQEADIIRRRAGTVRVLPVRPGADLQDTVVHLDNEALTACQAVYVIRLDGSTCLLLERTEGPAVIREGDPLEVAGWYQACHDAGMPVRIQVNTGLPTTTGK